MGQITKRGEYQWRAKVRRKGFPEQSRTFTYREDAEKWVRMVESEQETTGFIDRREADKTTLAAVLQRYQREVMSAQPPAMASIVLGARFQTIWCRPQPRMAAHRPMAAARIQPDT
ncbi:hypothetical protein [Hydrogenophaga sp. NH-16]|uniref:hypothetical protein n=1 Tax=Hydrogenophaga sp. NH-16 TaxID=2184519 RepID=UPI0019D46C0D|nr:hypothetical protein [Hydrogenophaga sp. NH-16]